MAGRIDKWTQGSCIGGPRLSHQLTSHDAEVSFPPGPNADGGPVRKVDRGVV